MRLILYIIYAISIITGVSIFSFLIYSQLSAEPGSRYTFNLILVIFLVIFGLYGIYGETFLRKLVKQSESNLDADISYFIKRKGFFGKLFLFPFIHIKSKYSFVIAFFGSIAWIIILMIMYFGLIKKILE
jgi:hypothetical protein